MTGVQASAALTSLIENVVSALHMLCIMVALAPWTRRAEPETAAQTCFALQTSPFSEQELISKAKQVFDTASGQKDPSVLSDSFRFEFPIISLSKEVGLVA